jgi:DNA invertase Pin-like site-specific DNA recombinase
MKLPIGLLQNPVGKVVLDPDLQVQAAVRTFFETFRRTGSATSTVRSFREQGLLFPRRLNDGPHKGELAWGPLLHWRALRALKNPRCSPLRLPPDRYDVWQSFVFGFSTKDMQ